ncbi:glycosyltransferase [Methylosinus sp. Sm6]|uniref:glycosyltransferase family protein n=1 Tax=Methylosinus sp. Sm6 TaxID=2866948 RepID=UPI001C99CBC3|nr:glycosyltransferase [Methylosinus sp. Sm6]MBY6241528.1 glycosyltransferase [Methylosinus sp. Sm6]
MSLLKTNGVVICGGRRVESTIAVVGKGFERIGVKAAYVPTRDYSRPSSAAKYSPFPDIEDRILEAVQQVDAKIVVWVMCKRDYEPGLIRRIKEKNGDIKFAFHSFDDPFVIEFGEHLVSSDFDFAITCCEDSIADYAAIGVPAVVLYPPFDEDTHTNAARSDAFDCDMSFIATNMYPPSRFRFSLYCRSDIVRRVAPLGDVKLFGPWDKRLAWGGEFGVPEMRDNWRGALRYEELPSAYKSSRINLNSHVRPDGRLYLNERFSTVLGSGGFLMTDSVNGLLELETECGGFVVYHSLEDLEDKCRFYLSNETERRSVIERGLAYATAHFSNKVFAEKILSFARAIS